MGIVLKVTHLHLGEELAIKVLLPEHALSPDVTARFLREAQSVVRLRGEHVARVTDVGTVPEGLPFMVMEYLRGVDLSGELQRRGTLPPGEAVDYVLQTCEALAEAHAHGIVHRDIKPANLFLTTRPDGTPLIKVLDFGISKAPITADSMATKTEIVMGTPGYMSPEQMKASKDVDARTDIWALGSVLYECLGGRRPFNGESYLAIALMAGTEPPPPLDARIHRGLQAAVLRCLEKDRRARFPSIAAFAAALAPFARNQREAATIVERTNLFLHRSSDASSRLELAAPSGQGLTTTTLGESAGATSSSPRRRRAIVGGISLLGAGVLLSAVTLIVSGLWHTPSRHLVIVADDRATASRVAETPPAANRADPETTRKATQCSQLLTEKQWPALLACASELDALGANDSARQFRAVATLETANEATDRKIRQALSIKNFKEAQTLLKQIPPDSIYHQALSELFDEADAGNVKNTQEIAQRYLDAHDCAGLKRYFSQNTSTSGTEQVIDVFKHAIVACATGAQAGPVISKNSPRSGNGHRPATPTKPVISTNQAGDDSTSDRAQSLVPSTQLEPVANATSASTDTNSNSGSAQPAITSTQPEPVTNAKPTGNDSSSGSAELPENSTQPGKINCDKFDINDIVTRAKNLFNARDAASALSLISAALECKQSVLLYRLAGLYACRAHDPKAAKQYFNKVPEQYQAPIEQACQLEGINVRGS